MTCRDGYPSFSDLLTEDHDTVDRVAEMDRRRIATPDHAGSSPVPVSNPAAGGMRTGPTVWDYVVPFGALAIGIALGTYIAIVGG